MRIIIPTQPTLYRGERGRCPLWIPRPGAGTQHLWIPGERECCEAPTGIRGQRDD